MKLKEAIKQTTKELFGEYRDVVCLGYEVVTMTKNTTKSKFIKERIDVDSVNVAVIKNRFEDIDGEINAIKVMFDVKYPRKRRYNQHEVYYKIID